MAVRSARFKVSAELHQKTHGIATRVYEENYLRSNKFATSWARVRADNPTFMENVPGQMVTEKRRDDSPSSSRSPQHNSVTDSSPNRVGISPYDSRVKENHQTRGRPPLRRRPVKKQKHSRSRSPYASKSVPQKENQSPARDTDEESGSDEEGDDINEDSDIALDDFDESLVGKISPRRQPWNDSVVVPTTNKPPPKLDARRCKHDLTFKPAVNTDHIVTKTYSGQDDIVIRDKATTFDDNLALTDEEEGYASPSNESSPRSNDNSLDRKAGKERMLTRREAKMYIKMMNVYGSDAFKRQRKEWFVKKVNEVQEAKSKFEEQEKKNLQKKRNEDKLKQERQLNYVRNKFRKEQLHRFQTQYVTARVLEYEKSTRHQYGLPEDFEDLAFMLKEDEDVDENGMETTDPATNETAMKVGSNKNAQQSNMKNKKNASQAPMSKKQKAEKQRAQREREEEERQKDQEQKTRQKQSAWYTHADTQPNRHESPTSYGTSGYESEKSPSEHNGNADQEPIHDTKVKGHQLKQKADQKRKDGRQEKPSEAQNRLASQKNIYEQKPQNRIQQRPVMNTDNPISKLNQRKRKDDKDTNQTSGHPTSNAGKNSDVKRAAEQGRETDSRTNLQHQERDRHKDIAHIQSSTLEKPDLKNNKHPETFSSKSNAEQVNDKKLQANRNELPSQGADKSKKSVNQFETAHTPSKDSISPTFKSKVNGNPSRPHQSKPQTTEVRDNNARNKQPMNDKGPMSDKDVIPSDKEEKRVAKPDQNQQASPKSSLDTTSSRANKALTSHKPGPAKPVVEDDGPINIKRVPLAGTISKENAPQTFGVTEHKLEDILSSPQTQQSNVGQSPSVPTKQPPRDALSSKLKPATSKGTTKENAGHNKPAVVVKVDDSSANVDRLKGRSAKSHTSNGSRKVKPKKSETLADKMFNIKTGPTWNPHTKVPKMEGIDTVVVAGKDGKGRPVRKRRDIDSVVREASNLLKVTEKDDSKAGLNPRHRISRAPSPAAVTLGSDFDVDDDDELEQEDIFERLRKKYNIVIDSDEEDDLR